MTRRVLIGERGGDQGLFVSRPGVDVLTAGDDDLLMSPTITAMQIVQTGNHSNPGSNSTFTVTVPDQGFAPLVLLWCDKYEVGYKVVGTTLTVHTYSAFTINWSVSGKVYFAVTNIPMPT